MGKKSKRVTNRSSSLSSTMKLWFLAAMVLAGVFMLFQWWISWDSARSWEDLTTLIQGVAGGGQVRVGLVAGHWQHDSGAVCPDGLEEVTINLDIAERTATLLRRAGYHVDVLAEFDDRLQDYDADVFLSIHTDSCVVNLSGFKIARLPESQVPERADRLVEALYREYGAATGLEPHYDTITYDMREYHAFREISPNTPGAIIELGFMGGDRQLLTRRPDSVARGLARGIIAFVRQEGEGAD